MCGYVNIFVNQVKYEFIACTTESVLRNGVAWLAAESLFHHIYTRTIAKLYRVSDEAKVYQYEGEDNAKLDGERARLCVPTGHQQRQRTTDKRHLHQHIAKHTKVERGLLAWI